MFIWERPISYFTRPAGTTFADVPVKIWPIRSKRFRTWLRRYHYESTGEAASPAAVRSALELLEARAQFDGPERAIYIRTAAHAGRIYLDLADEHWRVVEIGPDGWWVVACSTSQLPPAEQNASVACTGARGFDRIA